MGINNAAINVRIEDDRMITDSRNVAEVFGKQHKDVLKAIETIKKDWRNFAPMSSTEDVSNFGGMFFESTMPDSYGREQRVYYMTRDGFTLLAMGFTGKEAMQWKLKYIEAFNNLERLWNSPEMIMKRALDIANSRVKDLQLAVSTLTVENETMRPKAEYFDDLVDRHLLTNIRDTAKELKIKQSVFVKFLLDKKYMYRDKKGKLQPYSSALEDNLFEVKEFVNDKTGFTSTQPLITPKGKETFRLLMIL